MDKKIKSIAVVVPTITGREEELNRCLLSISKAVSKCLYNVKIFSGKDSSRERILIENMDEIRKYDRVTFIDDDDYVNSYYFDSLPSNLKDDEIAQSLGLCLYLRRKTKCLAYGVMTNFCGSLVTRETEIEYVKDCHIWGYFFPSEMICRLTKELLIPNPEITGALEDVCYWAWILANYKFRLIEIHSSIYYHMKLVKGLVDKINWKKNNLVDKAKEINPKIKYYVNSSGLGIDWVCYIGNRSEYHREVKIIDGMALKEFKLTNKEKKSLRAWVRALEEYTPCDEFLELLEG